MFHTEPTHGQAVFFWYLNAKRCNYMYYGSLECGAHNAEGGEKKKKKNLVSFSVQYCIFLCLNIMIYEYYDIKMQLSMSNLIAIWYSTTLSYIYHNTVMYSIHLADIRYHRSNEESWRGEFFFIFLFFIKFFFFFFWTMWHWHWHGMHSDCEGGGGP